MPDSVNIANRISSPAFEKLQEDLSDLSGFQDNGHAAPEEEVASQNGFDPVNVSEVVWGQWRAWPPSHTTTMRSMMPGSMFLAPQPGRRSGRSAPSVAMPVRSLHSALFHP